MAERDTGYVPDGRWAFDEEVTRVFDDMLNRSIPQYETMRSAVHEVGRRFVTPKTAIVDLGCSRGDALAPLVKEFGAYNRFVGVEISSPMAEASRSRFKGYVDTGIVEIAEEDLRTYFPPVQASLIMSVLTLQFVPIDYRQSIVDKVYEHLRPGGAFIFVEKILGASGRITETMISIYHEKKHRSGYTRDEIDRKRLALEGVLVPVTASWNEELLRSAGFSKVDCFWRWMNFAGWLAVK